jgi:glycerate 2-kinase
LGSFSLVPASPEVLLSLYDAAIVGADPGAATSRAIGLLNIPSDRRILLFAVGKAASPMATAAVAELLKSLHQVVGGVIVTPDGDRSPYPTVTAIHGDHPIPGRASFIAADKIGELSAGRRAADVAVVLISGGASSLIAAPLRGQAKGDLTALYQMLLASGLDITAMNAVRKRFSRWGGGRLALALAPAATHCLAISDVPDDELSVIGSGPCTPDATTAADVSAIIESAGLTHQLSSAHRGYLTGVTRGVAPETPKQQHPAFAHVTSRVIATNRTALDSVAAAAAARGMIVEIIDSPLRGAAAGAGEVVARKLIEARTRRNGSPRCVIWGGETTVTSAGSAAGVTGGGRCQELALAAARVLGDAGDSAAGIHLLAAGTDGRDGVTDAAGAVVDAATWSAIHNAGGDPASALQRHESTNALAAVNALIPRRRTETNVMDVAIGIVE